MEVILWLLLPAYGGIKTGVVIFIISYPLILLSTKYKFTKSHIAIHSVSLIALIYLVFFIDSKFSEELRRAAAFVVPYIIGAIFSYALAYKIVWKEIYENTNTTPEEKPRDLLLTLISIFLAYGCVTNLAFLSSLNSVQLNSSQLIVSSLVYVITSTLVVGAASAGIWFNQIWGALIYIGFLIISQPVLYLVGSWNINSIFIPSLITVLLIPKLKFMKQLNITRRSS